MKRLILALLGVSAAAACATEFSPLAVAARTGDTRRIAALAHAGHDVNAPDSAGNRWTPLLHAIHKDRLDSVEALIAAGADVNRTSPSGARPLIMAAGNGRADIIRRLLQADANPRQDADLLLSVAVSGGAFSDIEQPLLGRCNADVVRLLLERAPDLRARAGARTQVGLLFARFNGCSDVVQLMTQS